MTFSDVQAALDKGTVIMNAAGAHIPKLAGPCLACCQASRLPAAVNLYVTSSNKRTSAPPHTDKQDVIVIQSTGKKYWKVYAPPDASRKPMADIFARGKMNDDLPLYALEKTSPLLLEAILHPGDVLFVPAAFPHTTGTVINNSNNRIMDDASNSNSCSESSSKQGNNEDETSIHLTYGLDHHIWDLDYLSARRLALKRACVTDTALGDQDDDALRYVGRCNELPRAVHQDLFAALPLGLLSPSSGHGDDAEAAAASAAVPELIQQATATLKGVCGKVDEHFQTNTFDLVNANGDHDVWQDTIERLVQQGVELLETHIDMYLAAMEEGRLRQAEDAMTAHLSLSSQRPVMSPERVQRLSLFRVKRYYDEINNSKRALQEWALSGKSGSADAATSLSESSGTTAAATSLPGNWAFTMPLHVGDEVEADLGGAFFAAKVSRIGPGGDSYDVQFFDGDRESGLERSQIKLLKPPTLKAQVSVGEVGGVDTSKVTAKQLKRWKKQQDKLKNK
jgi:Cupin superfamily protein